MLNDAGSQQDLIRVITPPASFTHELVILTAYTVSHYECACVDSLLLPAAGAHQCFAHR